MAGWVEWHARFAPRFFVISGVLAEKNDLFLFEQYGEGGDAAGRRVAQIARDT